jgi:uncharacterized membrane protein YagU involved in acid resistance
MEIEKESTEKIKKMLIMEKLSVQIAVGIFVFCIVASLFYKLALIASLLYAVLILSLLNSISERKLILEFRSEIDDLKYYLRNKDKRL